MAAPVLPSTRLSSHAHDRVWREHQRGPPADDPKGLFVSRRAPSTRVLTRGLAQSLQGYLAHKKAPTPLGPPWDPRPSPTAGSWGGAVSYERGTPVSQGPLCPKAGLSHAHREAKPRTEAMHGPREVERERERERGCEASASLREAHVLLTRPMAPVVSQWLQRRPSPHIHVLRMRPRASMGHASGVHGVICRQRVSGDSARGREIRTGVPRP